MLRSCRAIAEFTAAFVGVLLILGTLVVWRLGDSPISSATLTPYIEAGIGKILPGTHVEIGHSLLIWDNVDHAVNLHVEHLAVKDKNNVVIAEVPNAEVRLSIFGIIVGRFVPTSLRIGHPQISLERSVDGELHFGGISTQSGKSDEDSDTLGVLRRSANNIVHAGFMRRLEITNMAVEVHEGDVIKWAVSVPEISLERTSGELAGKADIDLTQKNGEATLEIKYMYDEGKSQHVLATHFDNITPAALAGGHPEILGLGVASMLDLPLTGDAKASFDNGLVPQSVSLKLHADAGALNAPTVWTGPRAIKAMDVTAAFDRARPSLGLIAAVDYGGPKLDLTMAGKAPSSPKFDLDFDMSVKIANWPMDEFGTLWPKQVVPGAHDWINDNLSKGVFDKGEGVFTGSLNWNDLADITMVTGQGKVSASRGTVRYLDDMPRVEDVSAEGMFDLKQMTVQISGGGLGPIRLMPFPIKMTGFDETTQYIDIPLKISGPIPDIMRLIDHPPLMYAQKAGLAPDDIAGKAEGTADLRFPMLKEIAVKDIAVKVNMNLSDVASTRLVKGVEVTQGMLALDVGNTGFTIKGPVAANTVPFQIEAQQNFAAEEGKPLRHATANAAIKDNQWSRLGLDAFDGTRGMTAVTLQMTQQDAEHAHLSGQFDFTTADLRVDPLGWKKAPTVPATLLFEADMPEGKDISVTSIAMRGPQLDVKGKVTLSPGGEVKEADFDPFVIGRTDAVLHFVRSPASDGALKFEAQGVSLDVSGMRGGKEPARTDPRPKEFRLKVGKLITSDTGFIDKAEGYAIRDGMGWSSISLHGLAPGEHRLDLDLTPQKDGSRKLSMSCDDFGRAMQGLGFTDTVRDGNFKIEGASTPDKPRLIEGKVTIGHFDVRDLPVLMLLLNATSPFGITGILTNTVSFDHLKGKFRWEGDSVDLIHVNAAGSAVGMNVDGKVDMNSGSAKLYGTIVPFNMVNRFLNWIPILGDIITGGDGGGVLAVAYNIDGTLSDPKISVNPVSLLTPGFLRDLFFGGDDEDEESSDDKKPPEESKNAKPPVVTNFNKSR